MGTNAINAGKSGYLPFSLFCGLWLRQHNLSRTSSTSPKYVSCLYTTKLESFYGTDILNIVPLPRRNVIAQLIAFLFSPLLGEIADKKGSPFLVNILAACCIIGNILLTAMVAFNIDWLAFPAFILTNMNAVSAGGTMTVKTGLVFEGKNRIRYATQDSLQGHIITLSFADHFLRFTQGYRWFECPFSRRRCLLFGFMGLAEKYFNFVDCHPIWLYPGCGVL